MVTGDRRSSSVVVGDRLRLLGSVVVIGTRRGSSVVVGDRLSGVVDNCR